MPPSSRFSTYNPLSLVDDTGPDITQRLPIRPANKDISRWVASVNDETCSARSYIDDGADLLPPTRAGSIAQFGNVDSKYYQQKETAKRGYHPAVQKAVAGQINNTLRNIRVMGQFNVKGQQAVQPSIGSAGPPPGAVRVHLPKKAPAYVCHGRDSHVVVVDGPDIAIDSRPTPGLRPVAPRQSKKKSKEPTTSDIRPIAAGDVQDQQWQQPQSQPPPRHQQQQHQSKGKKNKKQKKQVQAKQLSPIAEDQDDWGFGNSDDSWTEDLDQQKKSYKAPTVEDAPGTPDDICKS
ncbi:hypothetical protein BDV96DRAFT_577993 [Lophiotrema nucula]|uniref:Uncharacterized protein n=1 Tax=Lophiotrema nucula TaxID=690887 RepID=A0A6A5Z541_9PLEO|nr:hypothetical protein BDV96DRAFT_577993 [Lophiotrema nucula]